MVDGIAKSAREPVTMRCGDSDGGGLQAGALNSPAERGMDCAFVEGLRPNAGADFLSHRCVVVGGSSAVSTMNQPLHVAEIDSITVVQQG